MLRTLLLLASPLAASPHVVVFLADDLSRNDCPLYGGRDFAMPNFDRLGKEGLVFRNAFVASPSCAPSRAALLTGLDPMLSGAMLNHSRPRAGITLWPAYFHNLGYETAAIGKTAHYAQAKDYGFDHASHFKYHEDTCIDAAVDWLGKRKSDKPLCLIVGTNWPHVPWPAESKLDPAKLSLPPTQVDTPETRAARARYGEAVQNADRDLGKILNAVAKNLGNDVIFVFTSDHGSQFPFGKWNLFDAGVHTPLVIRGPGIKPGLSDAMVTWTDLLPTLLQLAGGETPNGISGRSFVPVLKGEKANHRDRVFLTHSGDGKMNEYPMRAVRDPEWKYIRNLNPAAEHHTHVDKAEKGDGRTYWDSWAEKAKTDPAAAAIVKRYHTRPAEELYRISDDPHELKNLANVNDHAAVLAKMRKELDDWMAANKDLGLAMEKSLK